MNKKFLVFGLIGLLAIMFAAGVVSAQGADAVFDPIKSWFADWIGGEDISPNVVKILFWALVSMIIYSIADKLPFGLKGKKGLSAIFSIIVGFLAMAYVTPDEIYAIMVSYSAMGFVLSGVIPFIVLVVFTFGLASEEGSAAQRFTNKAIAWAMWVGFFVFILYKAYLGIGKPFDILLWGLVLLCGTGLALLGWVFALIRKEKREEKKATFNEEIELQRTKRKAEADDVSAS